MALQKQTISLNLSNGVDQKSDDKVGPESSFSYVRDVVFDKIGKLYKRFGTDQLSTQSNYPLSNPLTIGTSSIPSNVVGFKDQKLMINKGVLYSQYGSDNKWYFKGHHYPITISKNVIHSNQYNSYNPDSQTLNGITAYAYREDNQDNTKNAIRLTVIEESTGNYIINNRIIEQGPLVDRVKIIKFSGSMFAVYKQGSNLKIANIPTNSTTAITTATLFSDMASPAFDPYAILASDFGFDCCFADKAGVGERVFVSYYNSSNQIKVFSLLNTGVVDTTMGSLLVADSLVNRGCSIFYNATADKLHIGFSELSNFIYSAYVQLATFTTSAITVGAKYNVGTPTIYPICNIGFTIDPFTAANTQAFFDEYFFGILGNKTVDQATIYRREVSPTGLIGADKVLVLKGVSIAAKPITDDVRKTIYLPTLSNTFTQATHFVVDVFRGRSDAQPNVLAKFNYGIAATKRSFLLSEFPLLSTGISYIPLMLNVATDDSFQGIYRTGISRAVIAFNPKYAASNVVTNNAVYMSGGYIGYYDGSDSYEHGFFLNPEPVQVSVLAQGSKAVTATTQQQGSASAVEITQFSFLSAAMMVAIGNCIGPSNYLTFTTTTGTYIPWFKIAGSGTAPAAAGTKIQIDLDGNETPGQIAIKTRIAIAASGAPVNALLDGDNIKIINNVVGVVADSTVVGMDMGFVGLKNNGSVQYSAIFYYIDNNGQVIRSAPSTPTTATIVANSMAAITVWAPPITNKDISLVMVQLYATASNGTVFHKLSQLLTSDKAMSQNSQAIIFSDNDADGSINARETLYTSGGVLGNYSPGATRHISTFKNRLVITDEDQNSLIYSKTAIQGNPVEFSEELTIDLVDDSDPIQGHAQLDDKMIIGKGRKLYYLAGDGANDLGQGSSFMLPTLIPADVGFSNHNSIVQFPFGLIFKSDKGIYLLDRSLQVSYGGKFVDDYKASLISRGVLLKNDNQVRFTVQDSDVSIVYDYLQQKWAIHSGYGGTDATLFGDSYSKVSSSGVVSVENKSKWKDGTTSYSHVFRTNWLQLKDLQNYQRIYKMMILGDLKSPHTLNFKVWYDYDETMYDSYSFDSSAITGSQLADTVYEPLIQFAQQKCNALKIEVTVTPNGGTEECLQLVDMAFQVGMKQGLMKVRSEKRI